MSEGQRALAGFHGETSPALLERGKASRLLELTTVVLTEKLARTSVQKRDIFRPSFRNSDRFLVNPTSSQKPSNSLDQLLNVALSDIKKDILIRRAFTDNDVIPDADGSPRLSEKLFSVIKTLNQSIGEECVDDKPPTTCDPSSPYRSFR